MQVADGFLMIGLLGLIAALHTLHDFRHHIIRDTQRGDNLPDLLQDRFFLNEDALGRVLGVTGSQIDIAAFLEVAGHFPA
ncbi:MAG: hypothetical protein GC136_11250 [Alphaproteobacteria bacterium]|nr:hypothetical protein [Alphaproteobacteria bacterium]